ncbi:replication protein A 70 kDa DNA-binding subunit B-like isoform X1 [Panicum virgatum]|uniref:replication protein A 70 kDa DNA-binding subunit B-like isoform X1 n=1 Tax=Panicum virgatum TaxID=38727 RepID=UPI0019D55938|nr:replication protein A 70 kDa DNA-binding subunit B-like isoform X1 [Panicum virgatum]
MDAAKSVTPGAVSHILANPSPGDAAEVPELVVQVVDLKSIGTGSRFSFVASDGKDKMKAMLPTQFAEEVRSGKLQNLGLIRILDYTCNDVPRSNDKALIISKCEVVSQALDAEIKSEAKKEEEPAIVLKPKDEGVVVPKPVNAPPVVLKPKQEVKSASQIVNEQRGNACSAAPAARLAMTRRVHPLISLNPYQGNWVIKVRVTNKGNLRTYKNARGEGCVFNVELTDEDGTQIQATMFNEAAKKFYPMFELGKVYYVSKGSLRIANKQFKTVQNDYEMTLNENAVVEEAWGETIIPQVQFNFVKIDQLGSYVNGRELVDIVGVVQSVSPTLSVRRKRDDETIPKRDIVVADDSGKTVSVSLWNDLATTTGEELLDMVDSSPIIAIKSLRVSDFQGLSLSTVGKSTLLVNPDLPEAQNLKSWYDSEGKGTKMAPIGADMGAVRAGGLRSMYSDRVFLSHITSDPNLGQEKPVFFSLNAIISHIKPDQNMWYRACKTCNKKVTEAVEGGYWCEGCNKNDAECSLRYIMVIKVSDPTGEAWVSVFNEHAEKIIGCSADELDQIRREEGEDSYILKLKEVTWVPHLFRVSVAQHEYMNERRQRITVRTEAPVDYVAESKYLLEEIAKLTAC